MADQPKKPRRSWTTEQKVSYVEMRLTPNAEGKLKLVNRFCKENNIPIKTYYSWQKAYKNLINNPDLLRISKTIESKSRNPELIIEVIELSLYHPDWSARTIIKNLSATTNDVSIPTVQRILKEHNLAKVSKRFAHTEHEYIKNNLVLPKETANLLFKNNPYLNLYELTKNINGLVFFLKSLSLDYYFGKGSGYILVAIETNSLDPFLYYWDGKNKHEVTEFIDTVSNLADRNHAYDIYFKYDTKWPIKLNIPSDKHNTYWLDTSNEMLKWLNPFFNKIKKGFLKEYKFKGAEQFREDLANFALQLKIKNGPIGYPTWGDNPYTANRNHKVNLSFKKLNH